MAYKIIFTGQALEDLDKLDKIVLERIIKKIKWFVKQKNPLDFANRLKYDAMGQYRFRTGDYRVIFDCEMENVIILRIGHRSSIYK